MFRVSTAVGQLGCTEHETKRQEQKRALFVKRVIAIRELNNGMRTLATATRTCALCLGKQIRVLLRVVMDMADNTVGVLSI